LVAHRRGAQLEQQVMQQFGIAHGPEHSAVTEAVCCRPAASMCAIWKASWRRSFIARTGRGFVSKGGRGFFRSWRGL
jgi:hypothetical protein